LSRQPAQLLLKTMRALSVAIALIAAAQVPLAGAQTTRPGTPQRSDDENRAISGQSQDPAQPPVVTRPPVRPDSIERTPIRSNLRTGSPTTQPQSTLNAPPSMFDPMRVITAILIVVGLIILLRQAARRMFPSAAVKRNSSIMPVSYTHLTLPTKA
jgi:hypothetical protein